MGVGNGPLFGTVISRVGDIPWPQSLRNPKGDLIMARLKEVLRVIVAFVLVYAIVWSVGEHGHDHLLEPAKQVEGQWTCAEGQYGPFWDKGKSKDPVCRVEMRTCPVLWLPFVNQTPCPYRDFLGGPWTEDDEFDRQQMKQSKK